MTCRRACFGRDRRFEIESDGRRTLRYLNTPGKELTAMAFSPLIHPSSRHPNTSSP